MPANVEARMDELLIYWRNVPDEPIASGLPDASPSCHGYRSSRQWEGCDVDEDRNVYQTAPEPFAPGTREALGLEIAELTARNQLVLHFHALALAVGSRAFMSPRLPRGEELTIAIAEARGSLWLRIRMWEMFKESVDWMEIQR